MSVNDFHCKPGNTEQFTDDVSEILIVWFVLYEPQIFYGRVKNIIVITSEVFFASRIHLNGKKNSCEKCILNLLCKE